MFVASVSHVFWNAMLQLAIHLSFSDRKTRQWALPTFNATLMSIYGILLFPHWLFSHDLSATPLTDHVAIQLQSYMIVDLCYNALMRHDAIDKLLEFWTHHIVYTMLLAHAVNAGYTGVIASYLLLEIPAAIRAWGTIVPAWRSDVGFGTTFFVTRIVLPFIIYRRDCATYPVIAFPVFIAMQVLHIYWFALWCRSQMPRILVAALGANQDE